jgi:hypothetical protein
LPFINTESAKTFTSSLGLEHVDNGVWTHAGAEGAAYALGLVFVAHVRRMVSLSVKNRGLNLDYLLGANRDA